MELSHSHEFQFPMPTHLRLESHLRESGNFCLDRAIFGGSHYLEIFQSCMPSPIPPRKMQLMGREWPRPHLPRCRQRPAEPRDRLAADGGTGLPPA